MCVAVGHGYYVRGITGGACVCVCVCMCVCMCVYLQGYIEERKTRSSSTTKSDWNVLQSVCYSTLQCVAVSCSALQCVAVCCSVAVRCSALKCVAVCCSVLQCVAVCCSVLQCVAVCCRLLQCIIACLRTQRSLPSLEGHKLVGTRRPTRRPPLKSGRFCTACPVL